MFTIDEINGMLDEIAAELPEEIFRELNGGVSLVPDTKRSENDPKGGLYRLGEYRHDQMGRYVVLFYGSIIEVHGNATPGAMRESLRKLLAHELTHHLESLAGERDLEIEDKLQMERYLMGGEARRYRIKK